MKMQARSDKTLQITNIEMKSISISDSIETMQCDVYMICIKSYQEKVSYLKNVAKVLHNRLIISKSSIKLSIVYLFVRKESNLNESSSKLRL